MKKTVAYLLVCVLCISLCACGKDSKQSDIVTDNRVVTDATEKQPVAETEAVNEAKTEAEAAVEKVASTEADSNAEADISTEAVSSADVVDRQEETDVPDSAYPVGITDQAGRYVDITKEPERLVSGYYISSSLLIALGLADKMVGIEAKANKRPIYKLAAPELIELPSVGSAKEFDLEGCIALNPDLVILPLKLKETATTLSELGIAVLLVNPEDGALLKEACGIVATATNTKERAEELLSWIESTEQQIAAAVDGVEAPTVYMASNSSLLSTAPSKMYQSDMIRRAGGRNVADEIDDKYWTEVSYEQLLAWDPDYIILAGEADYTVEDVLADENLKDCKAVKNGQVYAVPSKAEAWDSPVPAGVLGSVWLTGVLHPELMTAEECNSIVDEFYEEYYGFTYSEK